MIVPLKPERQGFRLLFAADLLHSGNAYSAAETHVESIESVSGFRLFRVLVGQRQIGQ